MGAVCVACGMALSGGRMLTPEGPKCAHCWLERRPPTAQPAGPTADEAAPQLGAMLDALSPVPKLTPDPGHTGPAPQPAPVGAIPPDQHYVCKRCLGPGNCSCAAELMTREDYAIWAEATRAEHARIVGRLRDLVKQEREWAAADEQAGNMQYAQIRRKSAQDVHQLADLIDREGPGGDVRGREGT